MGSCGVLKTLVKALVLMSFIGFMIVDEIVPNTRESSTKTTTTTSRNLKHLDVIGRHTPVVHSESSDPNSYMMSKRRVPNGPDPIHNRRAGKSRQPPGRA